MKVTFPHMDTTTTFIGGRFFELLGHELIMPPKPTQHTINLGVKYSPEFACFPLKVVLGTYLEAIELGADTIVTSGGNGPCRAGYYGEVHKKILTDLGYDLDFIIFDEPKRGIVDLLRKAKKVKGQNSWVKLAKVAVTVYLLAKSLDRLKRYIEVKRAYVSDKNGFNHLLKDIYARYAQIKNNDDIIEVEKYSFKELNKLEYLEKKEEEKIRVGIVGEIYVVMQSAINSNIEEILNNYGVEVERAHYLSDYIDETIIPLKNARKEEIFRKAEQYIEISIGGHAKQTMGHIVDYKERNFDGIIHLKPFGCLPELVSQSMLDKISRDLDLPILSLSVDEQMAKANVLTRVEAFLNLIEQKKEKKHERK